MTFVVLHIEVKKVEVLMGLTPCRMDPLAAIVPPSGKPRTCFNASIFC